MDSLRASFSMVVGDVILLCRERWILANASDEFFVMVISLPFCLWRG